MKLTNASWFSTGGRSHSALLGSILGIVALVVVLMSVWNAQGHLGGFVPTGPLLPLYQLAPTGPLPPLPITLFSNDSTKVTFPYEPEFAKYCAIEKKSCAFSPVDVFNVDWSPGLPFPQRTIGELKQTCCDGSDCRSRTCETCKTYGSACGTVSNCCSNSIGDKMRCKLYDAGSKEKTCTYCARRYKEGPDYVRDYCGETRDCCDSTLVCFSNKCVTQRSILVPIPHDGPLTAGSNCNQCGWEERCINGQCRLDPLWFLPHRRGFVGDPCGPSNPSYGTCRDGLKCSKVTGFCYEIDDGKECTSNEQCQSFLCVIVRYDSNDSSVKKCVGTYVPAKKGEECGNETVPTCESGLVCKPDGADPKRCYEE